jgi:hypothetical protein
LFLDEFPEFGTRVLEVMRQPMEDKVVTISRAKGSPTFSANFQSVAAMNPFPLDCTQSTMSTDVFKNSILAIRLAMDCRKFPRKPEAKAGTKKPEPILEEILHLPRKHAPQIIELLEENRYITPRQ